MLDQQLKQLVLPDSLLCSDVHCKSESHSKDRDSLVLDIMSAVVECSHACIPLTNKVSRKPGDPSKNCPVKIAVPGSGMLSGPLLGALTRVLCTLSWPGPGINTTMQSGEVRDWLTVSGQLNFKMLELRGTTI